MATFNSVVTAPTAVQERNRFDLSCENITSNDFFKFKPVYARELVPGSDFSVKLEQFTRLAPLTKPMYGSCKFVNRAFFVPFRTVWKDWNAFITQTLPDDGTSVPSTTPLLRNSALVSLLVSPSMATHVSTYDDPPYEDGECNEVFDFCRFDTGSLTYQTFKFTRKGQLVYDILINLGYKINFMYELTDQEIDFSALPLMCLYKIHYDYYRLTQYVALNDLANFDVRTSPYLTGTMLMNVMDSLTSIPYQRDFFTSAWSRPVGPNYGGAPSVTINDVTNARPSNTDRGVIDNSKTLTGAPGIHSEYANSQTGIITQYLDTALHKATDFIKRYQLFGSRTKDIYKTLFGIDLSDTQSNRSIHIGKSETYVNIADVMQTTPTANSVLGEYAGKGIASGNGQFKYKTDEFGYFIIVSVLIPKITYSQGYDRLTLHTSPLQFFKGDFDKLGVQAISRGELLGENGTRFWDELHESNEVFGFTSRYAEYKQSCSQDKLSGLFALNSLNGAKDMDTYHLSRYLNPQDVTNPDYDFCSADGSQFDRVFADPSEDSDHFLTVFHFTINAWQPMSKLYDDYEWSECDGKKSSQQIAGTMLE